MGFSAAQTLRRRAIRADAMIDVRKIDEDAARDVRRRRIAAETLSWANARLDGEVDPDRIARIRANATIRFRRAIEATSAIVSRRVRRSDVLPGKVFTRRWFDVRRKEGAEAIASRLDADDIVIR